jgi:hypothetical protein
MNPQSSPVVGFLFCSFWPGVPALGLLLSKGMRFKNPYLNPLAFSVAEPDLLSNVLAGADYSWARSLGFLTSISKRDTYV